jgi:hypothetical protein
MSQEMQIFGIGVDPTNNSPVILLKDKSTGEKVLPIWIGILEATPLAASLQQIHYNRPMTHDLFKNFVSYMQMQIQKVEISDIVDDTYHARIYFSSQDYVFSLDARPSDAIILALKFRSPIYASDTVLQETLPEKAFTYSKNQQEILDKSEDGQKWLSYLQGLTSEDFGTYPV